MRFLSRDDTMSHNFIELLTDAIGLAVQEITKAFGDGIEIIEPDEAQFDKVQ